MLISGLGSDSQSWLPVLDVLAEYFKLIIFDNRGVGKTKYPKGNFQISTIAKDAVCLLKELGIEKADILGHSMGGFIAQEIAIKYPQKVNKLILISTCSILSGKNKLIFENFKRILERGNYELFIREFYKLIFTEEFLNNREKAESAVKHAINYPFPVTAEGFNLQVEAINNFNSQSKLDKIKAETIVISGIEDILITAEEIKYLADNIPNVKKTLCLENAAHSIHTEKTDVFTASVLKCLTQYN